MYLSSLTGDSASFYGRGFAFSEFSGTAFLCFIRYVCEAVCWQQANYKTCFIEEIKFKGEL